MPARRILESPEHVDLIELVRDVLAKQLAPQVAEMEAAERFPREAFRLLGELGVLG
ncbi:MAG: acyl-CoA dehydrogenase family protein, partial [Actinomycetales bacterium]|nr:acyl-CoA dehydrogenase family protein [Actinomycetales bacterium]